MGFLLFTLYAPMASFGEVAVGERRMSWSRPGRSAILGMVAARLGNRQGRSRSPSESREGPLLCRKNRSAWQAFRGLPHCSSSQIKKRAVIWDAAP